MSTSSAPVHQAHHAPNTTKGRVRPSRAARRFGYAVAASLNALLLYLVNVQPGWDAVPFLTEDTTAVLGLVNASIAASLVANLVYTLWDPTWLRALGEVVTTSIGVLSMVRIWQVWPVDLPAGSAWEVLGRVAVGVGIGGGVIGIVASLVRFAREVAGGASSS